MGRTRRGVTLTEVLIASAIAVVVVVGIGLLDAARLRMEEGIKAQSGLTSGQAQVALASFVLARELAQADRLLIRDSGGKIQIRYVKCPTPPCDLDAAANYHWDEYRISVSGGKLEHFEDTQLNCSKKRILATQVASLTFQFRDEAPAPPGGEPFGATAVDNNALEYSIKWDNGLAGPENRTHEFHGLVEPRPIAYTDAPASDLTAFTGDSGTGIDVTPVSAPPGLCPP